MNIYYYNSNYPEKRCCIGISPNNQYIHTSSSSMPCRLIEKAGRYIIRLISAIHKEKTLYHYFFLKRKGIIHSFNYTICGSSDWVCTFETITPRTNYTRNLNILDSNYTAFPDRLTRRCINDLVSPHCKAILAISNASYELETAFINKYVDPVKRDLILPKLHILHPPQIPLTSHEAIDNKYSSSNRLTFIFVGNDFFRKGGREVMDVLASLRGKYDFRLIIVSHLDHDDYATQSSHEMMTKYRNIIESSDYIEWYDSIDNESVLKLCLQSDVGLLPTVADTYGYSVLEMQASGCPVITTDIRSLREINSSDHGWVIHLPQNEYHEAYYRSPEDRENNHRILSDGLTDILEGILNGDKADIARKAHNSLEHILKDHSPGSYALTIDKYINT